MIIANGITIFLTISKLKRALINLIYRGTINLVPFFIILKMMTIYTFKKVDAETFIDDSGNIYKPLPLYEDYYIKENGEVYSTKWGKWKKLRTHINENGYKRVTLRHNGKTVVRRIARLVASAFLSAETSESNQTNPIEHKQVRHIDGNKVNDHFKNLRYK